MPDILSIGSSGLTAYRKLLETVGSNIVNANTEGYVRRDISLQATGESTMLPTARPTTSGSGVVVDSVRRGTDSFLQAQTYVSNAYANQASTLADSLTQLEKGVFTNTANVSTEVQNFYSSFSQLASAPTSTSARLTLLDAGERVATTFRATANQIKTNLQSVESAIDAALAQVNVLSTQLARLNGDISRSASGGQKPNDLLDQRDKLLQELSSMTGFTTVEAPNGSVDIYLGDTASGQKLIGSEGAHQLGAVKTNGRIDIAFDPATRPSITSQIKSGMIAGLMDFRREATMLLQNVDRLAVGFVNSVNIQHMQGVDQDGNAGKELFSAESLTATAGTGNTGLTKMNMTVTAAAQLTGATYSARYDSTKLQWTVTSSDGRSTSGASSITMDGVNFSFEGEFSAKDIFTAEPLKNASGGMRFLRTTPSEIAAALPLYVDQGTGNQGSGTLSVTNRDAKTPPAPLPNAKDIFAGTSLSGVDFLRNGAAFLVQAGTGPSEITSLGTLPALRFPESAGDLIALNNSSAAGIGGLTLTFNIDATSNGPIRTLDLFPRGNSVEDLARAINEAAAANGAADELFATVSGGALTINAVGTHTISNGSLDGFTKAGVAKSIKPATEPSTSAAAMRLFTRDGRQLTGPAMSQSEAAVFLTTANGFLSDAFYRPPTANAGYRGLNLSTSNDLLSLTLASKRNATIDVVRSLYNQVPAAQGQGTSPGAVYAMDVIGLPPIRLAGDDIGARNAAGIANALTEQMNASATLRTWLGTAVTILPDSPPLHFTVTVDGKDEQVTFKPGKVPAGAGADKTYLNSGMFEVGAGSKLRFGLVPDAAGTVRVMISAPQQLRTSAPTISISADSATATKLGLSETPATTRLTAMGDLAASLMKGNIVELNVKVNGQSTLVHIDGPQGRDGAVSWSMVDGQLQLASSSTLAILTGTNAGKLGFSGSETPGKTLKAAHKLVDEWLKADPITLSVSAPWGETTLTIDSAENSADDPSWSVVDGRMVLSSASSQLTILSTSVADRAKASRLGFLGSDLDLTRSSQTTAANELLPALLQARTPTLHLSGKTIGDKTITINSVAGQSGGISWAIDGGKLVLTSSDDTLTIQTQDTDKALADMLGFTGNEIAQNGKLSATTDLTTAMLSTQPVTVKLADNSRLAINAASGVASNGSWSIVNGRLRISSPYLAATVAAGNEASQQTARSLGFLGPDQDTSSDGTVIAAATLDSALITSRLPQIKINIAKVDQTLTLSTPTGTAFGVSWSVVDGRIELKSDDASLRIVTKTISDQQMARALGFGGSESFNGSGAIVASNPLAESLLSALPAEFNLADGSSISIGAPSGRTGATSWSVVDGHLKITGPSLQPGLQRVLADDLANTRSLGFSGVGQDDLAIGTQICLTSTAGDENNDLVDTTATRSVAGNQIHIGSIVPEDMIVQLDNGDMNGLRRISAILGERDTTKIPFPNITVKVISSSELEIIDRKSGVSLARRAWLPEKDVNYLGTTFRIAGNALAGDVFDISNDSMRAGDSRNAQAISRMATESIFGENQGSFQDVYTSVASTVGSTVASAEMTSKSSQQSASDLKSAYEAKTGVNLDTEAADLIRYQQAYQAAAQVVSTARDMFQTILKSF